ncbi:MAG: hypothetical protein U5K53_03325 [Halanaerobiales bacterium]|nr:hypothetical protein [Halanaerobiales bacterium]
MNYLKNFQMNMLLSGIVFVFVYAFLGIVVLVDIQHIRQTLFGQA